MPYKLTVPIGTAQSWTINLLNEQGVPVTTYSNSDTLTSEVWVGDDQPVLINPTVSWLSAPDGTVTVTVSADQTTPLEAGRYWLRVAVNGTPIPDNYLILTASPGTAAPLSSYNSVRDMLDYFPALATLQDAEDEEGYARQRFKARTWLERIIQRNRGNSSGYASLGLGGSSIYGYGTGWSLQGQDDPTLQGYLDQDLLLVKPIVLEMTAKKAISYVCFAQVGPDDKTTVWQKIGATFDAEAEALACMYTAEIDLNDDGYSDITIPCGKASYR